MLIVDWKMNYEKYTGLDCSVPCTMYGTLLKHKLIDDPFYGMNEKIYTELSDKDCEFYTSFKIDANLLSKEHIFLEFYGLDTLCHISLNGEKLAYTDNMHRKYSFDVKDKLIMGENSISLLFKSPTKYALDMNNKHYLWNNDDTLPGANHLRKAICMFGWDWAPKLPDMGIYRKVELVAYDGDRIEDVSIRQYHDNDGVTLDVAVTTRHSCGYDIYVSIDGQRVRATNGKAEIRINNPKLWWVRGYGEQHLYDMDVELIKDSVPIDANHFKIGLRTLTVCAERKGYEGEFCFVNNGVKIFAMGANYVPQDSLLSRINPQRTRKLIDACIDANYNCIRVWGGGYYPEDEFYDYCDEAGLIVWQDFMTACYAFWFTDEYRENYTQEAIYNIRRFRNHACLGIFCGNNELERNVLDSPKIIGGELMKQDYIELFERLLPKLCRQYAPDTFYWGSSPSSGDGCMDIGLTNSEELGDSHFYTPMVDYEGHKFRFCSEYGFQSFPLYKTVMSFAEPRDMNPFSRVFENHQKSHIGNNTVFGYIGDTFLLPYTFEYTLYASQLFQARAIRTAVEYFRSIRGMCMGSLYWQLNDCWPGASWSSYDYYGRYKALHYYAKRFYAPVTVGVFLKGNHLRVNVSNEQMQSFDGNLCVRLCRNDMSVIYEYTEKVAVDKLTSANVANVQFCPEDEHSNYIYVTLTDADGMIVSQRCELFVKPKHFEYLKPDIKIDFEKITDTKTVATLKSDVYAGDVYIDFDKYDIILSDNYFDIGDSNEYIISFDTDLSAEELEKAVTIKSVYNISH